MRPFVTDRRTFITATESIKGVAGLCDYHQVFNVKKKTTNESAVAVVKQQETVTQLVGGDLETKLALFSSEARHLLSDRHCILF